MPAINDKSGFSFVDIIVAVVVLGFIGYMTFAVLLSYSSGIKKNVSTSDSMKEYSYGTLWQGEYQKIDQATRMILLNNSGSFENLCNDSQPNKCIKDLYSGSLSTISSCDDNIKGRCWHNDGEWFVSSGIAATENLNSAAGLILNSGSLMVFNNIDTTCPGGICGQAYVDVNGFNKPNIEKIDIFKVNILKDSLSQ